MKAIFETLLSRARDCEKLIKDLDLIRPQAHESDLDMQKVAEILEGTAALYDLRFSALSESYSVAIKDEGFFNGLLEDCYMQWWGGCDDLRCAAEGAKNGLLDLDGIDNVLLGVGSMAFVRGARFFAIFEAAMPEEDSPSEDEPKKSKQKASRGRGK